MKKLKLDLEDLAVESFDTTEVRRHDGTVFGQNHCTCPTDCTCPGCPTCDPSFCDTGCNTCPDTCADTCDNWTCLDTCGRSCWGTCDYTCRCL